MPFFLRKLYLLTILIFFINITNLSSSSANNIPIPFLEPVEEVINDIKYWPFLENNMPPVEICGNGIDDDGDTLTDCDDPDCYLSESASSDIPKTISATTATTITSVLTITESGSIDDINIKNLDITHTYIDDLIISLTSPASTTTIVLDRPCVGENNIFMTLDDEAGSGTFPCPPTNGLSYQPSNPLSIFDGEEMNGTWTLTIQDVYGSLDGGTLNGWTLEIAKECNNVEICNDGIDNDGDTLVDCDDPDCSGSSVCIDCNLLSNTEFNSGTASWILSNTSPATANFTIDNTGQLSGDNSAFIDITNSTGTNWHTQFRSGPLSIDATKTYNISFEAKATASKIINVSLQQSGSPYTTYYYSSDITVTTTAQIFSIPNVTMSATASDALFKFYLNLDINDIWIDNVVFEEVNCTTELSFDPELCFFISDGADNNDELDTLYTFNYVDSSVSPIGPTGTTRIESMAMDTVNIKVYAVDGDDFGLINYNTGQFSIISTDVGSSLNGAVGSINIEDIDGMTYDHTNEIIWATERRSDGTDGLPDDLLLQINPITGLAIQDAFGSGVDYLVISTPENDLDDLAIAEDGTLYAISNYGGSGNQAFGIINKTTGAWTEIGDYGVEDVESLAFTASGQLVATTGKDGNDSNQLYTIDAGTGIATYVGSVLPGNDVEACDCISTTLKNLQIGDKVWADIDGDGLQDLEEPGVPNVVVNLLTSSGSPYLNNVGAPTTTTTDAYGIYNFDGLSDGQFIVEFVLPGGGESFSTQNAGGDDELDSDANTSTGRSHIITLSGSTNDLTVDAGLLNANVVIRDCDDAGDLFVADDNGNILRFDSINGAFIDNFITGLNQPEDLLVGSDDWLYVSNSGDDEIRKYSLTTGVLIEIVAEDLADPQGMTLGPDGNIYFNNDNNDEILKLDITTKAVTSFVSTNAGGIDGTKLGIEFGPDGNLYVASFNTDEVIRYNGTTGALIDIFVAANSSYTNAPSDLTFGPDGHLYVAGQYNDIVSKYNGSTGAFMNTFVTYQSGGLENPVNINFGDDGFLYVSSQSNNIGVLKYNGTTGAFIENFASAPIPNGLLFAPVPGCVGCPVIDVIGSNILCDGGSIVLESTVSGGLGTCGYQWESSPDTITWTPIPGETDSSLTISSLVADTYYRLEYSCSGNTDCLQAYSASHFVLSNPALLLDISFSGMTCLEDDTQLTADVSGGTPGYIYSWTGPNSFTSTLPTIDVSESGSYYVTVTDDSGCTAEFSAIVNDAYLPSISISDNDICEGESVTLTINSASAIQYNWGSNAGNASTSSVTVTPSPPSTDYIVTITNNQGCQEIDTATINVITLPTVNVTGPASICEGETTTLSPTTGGTWTSSNNTIATVSNSGVVTGVSAGTVNFIFTSSTTSCSSLASTNITIIAKTAVAVTGPTSICEGFTSQLSPTTGGTWTSNNGGIATVTNGGVVTGVSEGSTTFVFTNSTTGCASDATLPITVNDIPAVLVSGNTNLCIGSTTSLTPISGGTWASSNTAIATVTNTGLVTAQSEGTVTFTFTTSQGCTTAPTETVTVDPQADITISGESILCENATTTLTPSSGGGSWSSSNTSIATINSSGLVTAIAVGSVTMTYAHNSSACSIDPTHVITILDEPTVSIAGSTTLCVGENTQLNTTGSGGLWSSNDESIAIVSSSGVVLGISAGTVTFNYTSANGCESDATGTITVDPAVNASIDITGSVCLTDDSQLSAVVTGGTAGFTYSWTGPSGFTSANQTIDITLNGNYNLTVTDSKGCSSDAATFIHEQYEPFIFSLNTEICEGEDITLSINGDGGGTFLWDADASNATTSSVTVTPGLPSTSYTVTITNSLGCTSSATAIIDVIEKPTVGITGSDNICVGETTQLSPSSGGIWTSSNYSVANVSNSGLVTGLGNGSVTFTFQDNVTDCYSDATNNVTVNANEVVTIAGDNQICMGSNPILTPSVTGGSWTSSNTSVATINSSSGEITPVSVGNATIAYDSPSTGCYLNATHNISIYDIPILTINGPSTICEGSITYLSATASGTWTSSDESVAIVSNIGEVTGVGPGSATFSFVSTVGCPAILGTPITVVATPVIALTGPGDICIGETTSLSPTSGGFWISSNNSVATITNSGVVTAVSDGIASFTFIESNYGCASENNISVTVNAPPNITAPSSSILCIGETSSITPSSGGTWASSNALIATIANDGTITAISAGTVTFSFTNDLTGCISTASLPVTVQPSPSINFSGPTSICKSETTSILPSSGGNWSSTDVTIATITNQGIITGISSGNVQFIFTNTSSGCDSDSSNVLTVIESTTVSVSGPTNICVGQTTSLSPNTGGTWSSTNTAVATVTNSGIVTGISAGSVAFIFQDGLGCNSEPTEDITINSNPTATFLGSSAICIGESTTLSPSTGGTWSSSNSAVATISNSGIATAISAGSVTLTFTYTSTGCTASANADLTVNTPPSISIIGDDEICIGNNTNMSPSSGGTWISSNNSIASISANGMVTGISAGDVTFTFSESSSGCTSADSAPITILPKPTASIIGSNTICIGSNTTLSPSSGGVWTSNNELIATVTNDGVVTGVSPGLVKFTFTTSQGCASNETAPVIVYDSPSVTIDGSSSICLGESAQMIPSSGGTWTSANPTIASINNAGEVTSLMSGTTTFTFTDSNTGCVSDPSEPLTIEPTPITNLAGPSEICIGNSSFITPSRGGIWTSLNPEVASIQNNGEIEGLSAGVAEFIFTNLTTGCLSDTSSGITILPGPDVLFSGLTEICQGDTTYMSPSTGGTWDSNDESVATISNTGMVIGISSGTVSFQFTEALTNCKSEWSEALTVIGAPDVGIGGPSVICINSQTNLTPSTGGSWISLNPEIASVTSSGIVTGVASGSANFIFTDAVTGCSSDGTLEVVVQNETVINIGGISKVCIGYTIALTPSSGGSWVSNNENIATISNSGVVTGKAPGRVTFTFTETSTGCVNESTSDSITISSCKNHDFNVAIVNQEIFGNLSTNDNFPATATYSGTLQLISKPNASIVTFNVNSDGSYSFQGSKPGNYRYKVPVCLDPYYSGCPTSMIEFTLVENQYSTGNPVTNLDIATMFENTTGSKLSKGSRSSSSEGTFCINSIQNDVCIYTLGCDMDWSTVWIDDNAKSGNAEIKPNGIIDYTPNTGFIGFDTIYYGMCADGYSKCNTTMQVVTVNHSSAANTVIASDDFEFTLRGSSISGNILGNDSDAEGDSIIVTPQGSLMSPIVIGAGEYYIDALGNYSFTPNDEFSGHTEIIYQICDDNVDQACMQATLHLLVFDDISVKLRVYLQGALMQNGGETSASGLPLMRDDLRVSPFTGENYIPLIDPYTFAVDPWAGTHTKFNEIGPGELAENQEISDSLGVFGVSGENAIVDWVHVELRSKVDMTVPIATRSGLLQRDGDVVDLDGVSDLRFNAVNVDSFYVVVKHRSHLGVMSEKVSFSDMVDFTSKTYPIFNFGVQGLSDFTGLSQNNNVHSGYSALWAGDFDSNGKIKFTNPGDDQNVLFIDVLFTSPDFLINYDQAFGYMTGDFNMNSKTKYTNPSDDINYLFSQILLYPLNSSFLSNYNSLIEQIPSEE